ncbi:MAG: hypothetical protein IJO97_05300 [Lachnospiraceae bacterium]|nr:hypothetical protein [Lachnospiraceae bacterium]
MDIMEKCRDDYFRDCEYMLNNKPSYVSHVNKFIAYLKIMDLADRPKAIDRNIVDACIGYYRNEKKELNARATMEAHLEALKSFYDYLGREGKAEDIFPDYDYQDFKEKMVKKYELLEPVERGSFECEEVIEILKNLDQSIGEFSYEESGIRDEERYLQRIILRIFVKITLIAPAKRNVITRIKNKDFEDSYKKLNVNSVKVNIPSGLSRDIINAIRYAEEKNSVEIEDDDELFEFIYRYKGNFRGESLNTWFNNVIKDFNIFNGEAGKKTYPVEPIRNTAIQMMADNMVNPVFISKITGITFSSIEAQYYKSQNSQYEEYINRNINRAIAQNDYYYYI